MPHQSNKGRQFRRKDHDHTAEPIAQAMLDMAKVNQFDIVYDLGCGRGNLVLAAATRGARRAIGIDLDEEALATARVEARNRDVVDKTEFVLGDVSDADLSQATVVLMYVHPAATLPLIPRLKECVARGARIVSQSFDLGPWPPTGVQVVQNRTIYLWAGTSSTAPVTRRQRDIKPTFSGLEEVGVALYSSESEPRCRALFPGAPESPDGVQYAACLRNGSHRDIVALAVVWQWQGRTRDRLSRVIDGWRFCTRRFLPMTGSHSAGLPSAIRVISEGADGVKGAIRPGGVYCLAQESTLAFCASRARDPLWIDCTVQIDGVLFVDGEFVGRNRSALWETVYLARAYQLQAVERIRMLANQGIAWDGIISDVLAFVAWKKELVISAGRRVLHRSIRLNCLADVEAWCLDVLAEGETGRACAEILDATRSRRTLRKMGPAVH